MDGTKAFTPFQIILIAIFAVGAVVGLIVFATFSGGGTSKQTLGTVVLWGTLPSAQVTPLLQDLRGSDQRFKEITYVEQTPAGYENALANALAAGTGPDAVIITQEMLMSEKDKLQVIPSATIPERTFIDSYLPLFELYLTTDGTYGVPLVADPLVLYYNRATLASAGVAEPPATWEAVSGIAEKVSTRAGSGLTRSAIALGEYGNVRNARAILSLLLMQSGTPITERTPSGVRAVFAGANAGSVGVTPAQSAVSYYAQFADPAKTVYSWNRSLPESREAFLSGDLALYLGFASEEPALTEGNPNLDFDMARVPVPGTAKERIGYSLGYAVAIPKAAPNAAGGYALALALGSAERTSALGEALSMAPAFRRAVGNQGTDRFRAIFYPEALVGRGWLSPAPAATDAAFSAMIGDIASGRQSLEKALSLAAQAIDASL